MDVCTYSSTMDDLGTTRKKVWLVINDDPISFWYGYVYHWEDRLGSKLEIRVYSQHMGHIQWENIIMIVIHCTWQIGVATKPSPQIILHSSPMPIWPYTVAKHQFRGAELEYFVCLHQEVYDGHGNVWVLYSCTLPGSKKQVLTRAGKPCQVPSHLVTWKLNN